MHVRLTRDQVHPENLFENWMDELSRVSEFTYLGVELDRGLRVFDPNHRVVKLRKM